MKTFRVKFQTLK